MTNETASSTQPPQLLLKWKIWNSPHHLSLDLPRANAIVDVQRKRTFSHFEQWILKCNWIPCTIQFILKIWNIPPHPHFCFYNQFSDHSLNNSPADVTSSWVINLSIIWDTLEDDLQEANVFPNFMLPLKRFRDANVEEARKKYPGEQSMATGHDQLTTNIVLSNEHNYTYCRLHQGSYLSSTAHTKTMMAI